MFSGYDYVCVRGYQSGLPFEIYFYSYGIDKYKDSIRVRAYKNGTFVQVGFTKNNKFSWFNTKTQDLRNFGYDNIELLRDYLTKNYLIVFNHWHHVLDDAGIISALVFVKRGHSISTAIIKAMKEF